MHTCVDFLTVITARRSYKERREKEKNWPIVTGLVVSFSIRPKQRI